MISQNAYKLFNIKYEFQEKIGKLKDKHNRVFTYLIEFIIKFRDKFRSEIQIFIKIIDEMEHSNKMRDIKINNQEKTKLSANHQNLFFQGDIFDNDKIIDGYQILEKSGINICKFSDKIKIIVRTFDGKPINKSEKIDGIKFKIQNETDSPLDEQKLIYQNRILKANKIVDEYQICDQQEIDNFAKLNGAMHIFAKTMDEKTFRIEIRKLNKIIDIKKKIEDKLGLLADNQKIIFQAALLDDNKTVDEYQIYDQSVIKVVARLRGGMQIFAKTLEGKTITLEVQKSERIINVKKKIQEKTGLNPDEQILIYQGGILADDKTIDEYQICDNSVINVVVKMRNKMQIFANTLDGKTVSFKVDKSYKIIDVKYKIQEIIGFDPDEQKLIFQGGILEDDKTIDDYQICDQSWINVVDKYRIFLLAKPIVGINNAIFVHKSFRIIDIKYKIQEKTGLSPDEQNLVYHDKILNDDDDKTLKEYGIDEKSVIDIVVKMIDGMQLFVKKINGSTIIIYVRKSDKIRNVKLKIQEKLGLHQNEQKLTYQGKILSDDKTVDEYQMYNQSVIDIDAQIKFIHTIFEPLIKYVNFEIKLFAKIIEGKIISINIGKKDKIKNIKWQIQFQTGLHPDLQKLIYNDVVLEDEKMVKDYPISAQSALGDEKLVKDYPISAQSTLEDEKIVKYYPIFVQSPLKIVKMIEIFVKLLKNKIFSIYLLRTDSIGDVKCRIEEKSKLPRDEQILIYRDKLLNDDSKTVDQYGITEISIINIFTRLKNEIQILVQVSNQSIIPINVVKTAKVVDVKSKIADKTGLQLEENTLVYKNKILDNQKLLSEYQIDNGCVISIDNSQFVLFIQAIKSGSLEKVKNLYDNKFLKMKNERFSPMHYACKQDNADIVKFLIKSYFKVNTIDEEYNMPIHYACINGCVKILELLIQNKCKIEACDSRGMKPIHLACLNGNFQNVKLLIENECNLESKDYLGRRPIHLACFAGKIDIVKLLIQKNCKINVVDHSHKSPFNIADKENFTDIVEIMDEGISREMIDIMITELDLKCHNDCDHRFCPTSLCNKTFNKGRKIGKGSAGKVYQCKLSQSLREIAMKKISKDKIDSRNIEGNINRFIKKINHERIIKYFGAISNEKNIFIFMEFMSKGSLRSQISKNPPLISNIVIRYTMQILEGLQFLHHNKIIHRDIKPDNILLDNDGNVKLTDLGLGLFLCTTDGHSKPANTFCGTTYYMAPEIVNGYEYSYSADIWALGVTVIEMATGMCPFQEFRPETAIFKIATIKKIPYQLPPSTPDKIKLLIDRILIQEPSRRYSASNLLISLKTVKGK